MIPSRWVMLAALPLIPNTRLLTAQESRPGAAEKIARAWLTFRRMTPEQKKALAARAQRA